MNKNFYKTVLMFTPLFLTTGGIYQGEVNEAGLHLGETGFVFPLILFIGLAYLFITIYNFLQNPKDINFNQYYTVILTFTFCYTLTTALIGFGIYGELIIPLRWFQFISLLLGIGIFYYLIYLKKIDVKVFLKSVFYFLMILIPIHYLSSILEVGIINSLSSISPNIFFFGVYQSRIYYPYLIVSLFFLSILSIKSNFVRNYGILILIFYIFSLQVRGAFISLIVYLFIYFLLIYRRKILSLIILTFMIVIVILEPNIIPKVDLGRFERLEAIYTVGGRTNIWLNALQTDSISQLIFGNLFYDPNYISAHNQYIHFYNYGGILLLLLFLLGILPFIKNLIINIKSKEIEKTFLLMLFFVPLVIDLNINVPLNNVNSGIVYLFIWSLVLYCTRPTKKKEISI